VSSGLGVLVDQAIEDIAASIGSVDRDHRGRIVLWWVLVEALMWSVVIEMERYSDGLNA
jgi:hypothetical protein